MADSELQELLIDQLRDLYDAEKQLTKALPKLAKAAEDEELAQGFREHLEQTKQQVSRIEQIFESLGQRAKSKPCEAMRGLVQEGQEAIEEDLEGPMKDLALIAAARRVEHYETAAYDTLVLAAQAGKQAEVVQLLQETLREEVETDKRLATAAKRLLKEAAKGRPAEQDDEGSTGGGGRKTSGGRSASTKGSSKASSSRAGSTSGSSRGTSGSRSSGSGAASKSRSSSRGRSSNEGHSSNTTTDHEEIRQWAEERGGKPACVRGTGGKGDIGMIRLEFPGARNANDAKLEEISWDEFFEKFDENGLALVYQEETAGGQKSNFNKLVSREGSGQKTRSAR